MKILVTGALGFIASHLVDKLIEQGHEVCGIDALFLGSDIKNSNSKAFYTIIDLNNKYILNNFFKDNQFDQIYHYASETHVDRSIINAQPFIDSNISGTYNLYDCVKKYNPNVKILLKSTDEVMGELQFGSFKEYDKCEPKNMYSMTKQAQEAIARSYFYSDGIKTVITRCCNVYGPRQYSEKFLPVIIKSILNNTQIPIYGLGTQIREWCHCYDSVDGDIFIMENGIPNEIYHIGSGIEKTNIDVVNFVLKEMNASINLIKYVEDRKGHDKRYSLCTDKINNMGWLYKIQFEDGIKETINWYKDNKRW